MANKTNTYYYNDNWQVLCDYRTSTTLHRLFVYGNYIDEVLMINSSYLLTLARMYVHDHLYSPVALVTRFSGAVYERYEYDAYGNCHILESDFTSDPDGKSDVNNPYLFTGRDMDTLDNGNLNIMNYRHRYYDSYTGRFTTHDPMGYKDGMNLCEYVKSNPIRMTDPHGTCPCMASPWWGLVKHGIHCEIPGFECNPKKNCYFEWIDIGEPDEKTYVECMADNPEGQPCSPYTHTQGFVCENKHYECYVIGGGNCTRYYNEVLKGNVSWRMYDCQDYRWVETFKSTVGLGEGYVIWKMSQLQLEVRVYTYERRICL